jgi:hypothetical protein
LRKAVGDHSLRLFFVYELAKNNDIIIIDGLNTHYAMNHTGAYREQEEFYADKNWVQHQSGCAAGSG